MMTSHTATVVDVLENYKRSSYGRNSDRKDIVSAIPDKKIATNLIVPIGLLVKSTL